MFVLAACGNESQAVVDAGADDAGSSDASAPGACDAPALFFEGIEPTRVLHVAADAAPGGDGSAAAPFRTIEEASIVAQPGDAIRLGPGTHPTDQFVNNLRGTAEAPIWIGGEPGETRPVIEGGVEALHLTGPAYVVVHDLEITGQTANGINVDDGAQLTDETAAHHVAIVRVNVHDVGTGGNNDCIKLSGVRDVAVYDSVIARCGAGGSGVDHVGCHRSVVARNVFDGAMSTGVQVKGGSTDVDVRQNKFRIAGARAVNLGGSTGFEYFRPPLSTTAPNAEARRIRVFNNVVGDLSPSAAPFAFVGCVDCLVAHNAVFGEPRWIVRILQETTTDGAFTFEPASNGRVINNSFTFTAAALSTAVNVGPNTAPETFTFSHNLWYAVDDPARSAPSLPVAEDGSIVGQASSYVTASWDPYSELPFAFCGGSPEQGAAIEVPEVDGTMFGECYAAGPRDIGPSVNMTCPF